MYGIASRVVVKAKTHCDVLLLNSSDVAGVLQHYPSGTDRQTDMIKTGDGLFS